MDRLPAHDWDDEEHRVAIHDCFTKWFVAYEGRCFIQANAYRTQLRRLTQDAEVRRALRVPTTLDEGVGT